MSTDAEIDAAVEAFRRLGDDLLCCGDPPKWGAVVKDGQVVWVAWDECLRWHGYEPSEMT